ncbi:hypothetical protein WDW89_15285 [Deltaproteobacteria bacterium TL4]
MMEELLFQFKSNKLVRYTVLILFVLLSYVFSGGTFLTTLFALIGLFLGRLSYDDYVDGSEV